MKKFFAFFAALLFAGSMMAQVTITPSAMTAAESVEINATIEGVSLNITQGTVTADQIRIFKNQTITISAESNITSIVFTCTANGAAKYGPGCFAEQDGYTFEEAGKTGTWTGSATSVTFTASSNQVRATSIVVTLAGGVTPPVEPDTIPTAAPAVPAQEEANVMAVYCNHYATNTLDFNTQGWGCGWQDLSLNGTNVKYARSMTWDCLTNWGATSYNMSAYEKLHVDIWAPAAASVKVSVEALSVGDGGSGYKNGVVVALAQGWNAIDIDLASFPDAYNFADMRYVIFEQYQTPAGESFEQNPFAFANIYFWKAPVLPDPTNCAEAREAALSVSGNNVYYKDSTVYTIEGYVTAIQTAYNDTYHNISFWMADAADGGNVIQAYRAACASAEAAPVVGDKVQVTGALTKYGNTPEFGAGCTFVITEHVAPGEDPVNLGPKTIAEFLELANMKDTCILTGVIDSVVNTQYGNFNLVDATGKVYVYGLLTAAGESKKCYEEENLAVGDTLTVKAIYNLYNNKPQVKNAIFVEVKHVPVIPVEGDTIVIDIESGVEYVDYVATQGWWQFMAENEDYELSLSNNYTTQAAGVYTIADMDASYTYVYVKATETEVGFVDGQFTLTEGADGSRTIVGLVTGEDGNIYDIKLVFKIPTPETTVNVEIPLWGIADASGYYGITGYIFYGETEDENIYVQLTIPGSNPIGQFTYDDCYTGGTGISVGEDYQSIYSMDLLVEVTAEGRAIITADILCLNNTLYHVTTPYGEGFESVEAAVKAVKKLIDGNVVIEKAGVRYSINGQVIR